MNVLSLFDGMSCGKIALETVGIKVDKYFASEIDKYALQISKKNYPEIIQLGDIKNHREWALPKIDLILAGFPCQSWSVSGKGKGDTDPRGALVHDILAVVNRIKETNPSVKFLYENVKMKKEFVQYLNSLFGCIPIEINSSLVSAQNRRRLYWTNIPVSGLPENKKIYLKDILEHGVIDKDKSLCIDANYFKGENIKHYFDFSRRQLVFEKPDRLFNIGGGGQGQRVYNIRGKTVTLSANGGGQGAKTGLYLTGGGEYTIRKLSPLECERLQTVPEGYTTGVSNTQRYKMLGNGWTVDIICHILKNLLTAEGVE